MGYESGTDETRFTVAHLSSELPAGGFGPRSFKENDMRVSTVLIDRDGVAVRINESDFDPKTDKVFVSKPEAPAKEKEKAASKKAK